MAQACHQAARSPLQKNPLVVVCTIYVPEMLLTRDVPEMFLRSTAMKSPNLLPRANTFLLLATTALLLVGCGGSGGGSGGGASSTKNTTSSVVSSSSSSVASSSSSDVSSSSSVSSSESSSSASSVSSSSSSVVDVIAPTQPKSLKQDSISTTEAKISWLGASDNVGVVAYRIYRDGIQVGETVSYIRRFSDQGLTPGADYSYTVSAGDAAGNWSRSSSSLKLKTQGGTGTPTTPTPGVPVEAGEVALDWFVPNRRENGDYLELDELGGYEIRYKRPSDSKYTSVYISNVSATSHNLGQLTSDYRFEIAAYDSNGLYSRFVAISPR